MRCEAHLLAVGEDGLCLLCRSERGSSPGRWLGTALLSLAGVAAFTGVLAFEFLKSPARAEGRAEVSPASVLAAPANFASRARGPKVDSPPSPEVVRAAARATPIVMFSTGWCDVCARARAFLDANEIQYRERDIDHDESARAELERRTGKTSIPTFVIDGKQLEPGFSSKEIVRAIAESVERRLGVEGLDIEITPPG